MSKVPRTPIDTPFPYLTGIFMDGRQIYGFRNRSGKLYVRIACEIHDKETWRKIGKGMIERYIIRPKIKLTNDELEDLAYGTEQEITDRIKERILDKRVMTKEQKDQLEMYYDILCKTLDYLDSIVPKAVFRKKKL